MEQILWDQNAKIFKRIAVEKGPPFERAVCTGPLNTLIEAAINGAEGPLGSLFIRTDNGSEYGPDKIVELSRMPNRPKL